MYHKLYLCSSTVTSFCIHEHSTCMSRPAIEHRVGCVLHCVDTLVSLLQAPSMWSCSEACSGRLAEKHSACSLCDAGFATHANICQTTGAFSNLLLHEKSQPCWRHPQEHRRPLSSPQPQDRTSDRNIFNSLSSSPPLKRQCIDIALSFHGKEELQKAGVDSEMALKPFVELDNYYLNTDLDELPDLASDGGSDVVVCTGITPAKAAVIADVARTRCIDLDLVVRLEKLDDKTATYCSSNSLIVGSAPLPAVISIASSNASSDGLPLPKLHQKPLIGSDRKRQLGDGCPGPVLGTTVCKKNCVFRPVVSTHLSCSSHSSNNSRHFTDIFNDSLHVGSNVPEPVRLHSCSEAKTRVDAPKKCRAKLQKHTSSAAVLAKLLNRLQPKLEPSSSISDSGSCKSEQLDRAGKRGLRDGGSERRSRWVRCRTRNPSSDSEDSSGETEDCLRDLPGKPLCLVMAPLHAMSPPSSRRTTHTFSDRHTEMVECCLDEGCSFLQNAVVTLRDFTTAQRYPTVLLLRRLLTVLIETTDRDASYNVYNILNEVRMQHSVKPGELPFTWNDVQTAVERLHLPLGVYSAPATEALSSALALQYMTSMLEDELFSRPITAQRQVTRSITYRVLSTESKFSNVKILLQWISDALHFGQYCETGINSVLVNLHIGTTINTEHDSSVGDMSFDTATASDRVPKILPIMQRLLNLVIIVSRCPEDCAKRIAVELERLYMHLPTLFQRHLLVTSITSRLLRLKLVQRILEDHCSDDSEQCGGCNSGAICLSDLITCYFCCVPPQNLFTPPPTPERDDDADSINVDSKKYSPESCEELSMLLYLVVDSYIAYSRGRHCLCSLV